MGLQSLRDVWHTFLEPRAAVLGERRHLDLLWGCGFGPAQSELPAVLPGGCLGTARQGQESSCRMQAGEDYGKRSDTYGHWKAVRDELVP